MGWGNVSDSFCNIARSLSVVGDRWTLLIMREVSLGNRRFEEIQAQTGMSSHLLSNRLKRLEEDKILERRVYNARPLRHEYFATPRGKDLDGVILALRNWDLRWGGSDGKGAAAVKLTDKRTGAVVDGNWQPPAGEPFSFSHTTPAMSKAWKAERDANSKAFHDAKKPATSDEDALATRKAFCADLKMTTKKAAARRTKKAVVAKAPASKASKAGTKSSPRA